MGPGSICSCGCKPTRTGSVVHAPMLSLAQISLGANTPQEFQRLDGWIITNMNIHEPLCWDPAMPLLINIHLNDVSPHFSNGGWCSMQWDMFTAVSPRSVKKIREIQYQQQHIHTYIYTYVYIYIHMYIYIYYIHIEKGWSATNIKGKIYPSRNGEDLQMQNYHTIH